MLDVNNPVRRVARSALHALEDAFAIPADKLGAGTWIPGAPYDPEDPGKARPALEEVGWKRTAPIGMSGVCRLSGARVRMLRPRFPDNADPRARLAVVFVAPFRRLDYPYGPRALPRMLRGGLLSRLKPSRPTRHLSGRVALLGNHVKGPNNYYHFWADTMGDLAILRHLLPLDGQPDYLLVSHADLPWQLEILDMCGVDRSRVIRFTDYDHLAVDELLVPLRDKGGYITPPWLARGIRQVAGYRPGDVTPTRRVYLSRADASWRPVSNEEEVRALLRCHGFEIWTASELTVAEQQWLFEEAAVVVAPHGGGLTNLVWCQEGARAVELLPEEHRMPCFMDIANQRGLDYEVILCPPESPSQPGSTADIRVPIEALGKCLQELPANQGARPQ